MIDNFELIKPLLTFEKSGDFYFVQILQRKKDIVNKSLFQKERVIKEYFIENSDYLLIKKKEMITLANLFNARVTIWLNKRNYESLAFKLLSELSNRVSQKAYKFKNLISSVIQKNPIKNEKFLIDIDNEKIKKLEEIKLFLLDINPPGEKVIIEIPSKEGVHLITKPFDVNKFKTEYSDIDIHKDNPTNLYIPKSKNETVVN